MPEEIEVPTEHLHETIHEAAEGHHLHMGGFNMQVALSTAILAVVAAVSALLAGHAANEAVLEQIQASDKWNFYQAKSIKESVLSTKLALIVAMGKTIEGKDTQKAVEYKTEMEEIKKEAEAKEAESGKHMHEHVVLARAVTLFQIAIALAAVAVLTKKRPLWLASLALGVIGAFFLRPRTPVTRSRVMALAALACVFLAGSMSGRSTAGEPSTLGDRVLAFCKEHKGKRVGNGECTTLVVAALQSAGGQTHGPPPFRRGRRADRRSQLGRASLRPGAASRTL